MNKLQMIVKAAALVGFVLTTNSIQATETTAEAVLVPVKNTITGEVEMLICPDYPACFSQLLDDSINDKHEKADDK